MKSGRVRVINVRDGELRLFIFCSHFSARNVFSMEFWFCIVNQSFHCTSQLVVM